MVDVERIFAQAQQALAGGDPTGAVRLLDRLPGAVSTGPATLHLRALALKRAGRLEEARAAFERAHRAAPRDPEIANNYANLLKQLGDREGALELYNGAIAARPNYRDARFNKALLLQSLGKLDEALTLLNALCAADARDARAHSARGAILLASGRHAEAASAFDAALRLQPGLATALAGRAQVALEQGEGEAGGLFRRARAANPGSPEVLLGMAEALEAEGDREGIALLAQAVAERPDWIAGYERLARMRAEAGDEAFTSHYEAALERAPHDRELRLSLARILSEADRYAEALHALGHLENDPPLLVIKAFYAGEAGDPCAGLALLDRMGGDAPPAAELTRGRLALASGDIALAVEALERALAFDPGSVPAWSHLELAWRASDDPRRQWLSGQPGLFGARDIGLSSSELTALAELLRSLHRTRAHPIGQSLRGGTQTRGRLFLRREPALARLHEALAEAIEAHRAGLPPFDPEHPLLRHRQAMLRIAGSWSVRLTGSGFHVHHIHPQGVLSSACYICLPDSIGAGESRDGWLELGRPPAELNLALEPLAAIEPRPGRLALFPSYLFHGTRPFGTGERLTVAFDVSAA
jgi:tetratricopeptide (TPR) repeat protein